MGSPGSAARGALVFAVFLSLVASIVIVVGLAGMQSVCTDFNEGRIADYQARQAAAQQSDLMKNVTEAVSNSTRTYFDSFMSNLARSSSFVTCARIYSLHWWAWVLQLMLVVVCTVSLCGESRMSSMGLPLLVFTGTVVVLDTIICNKQVGMQSYSTPNQSGWASTVLAGFILACIANYIWIFVSPSLMRIQGAREAGSPLAKEIQI